jgi:NADPH-dependent methylglyoxal reductase
VGISYDVHDVAKLHVLQLDKDKLAGLRLFIVNAAFNVQSLLNIVQYLFPELDGKVGQGGGGAEGAEEVAESENFYHDTIKTEKAPDLTWTPLETTIRDSIGQILKYKKKPGHL